MSHASFFIGRPLLRIAEGYTTGSHPVLGYGAIWHVQPWGKDLVAVGVLITLARFMGWGVEPIDAGEPISAEPSRRAMS